MNYQQPREIRDTKRYKMKSLLLHFLFPIRIIACITLAILSYCHWIDVANNAEKGSDETNIVSLFKFFYFFNPLIIIFYHVKVW